MEKRMSVWWDREGDFLEIIIGKPRKGFVKELGNDIFLRVDAKNQKPIGFSILNFTKHFGKMKKPEEIKFPIGIEFKGIKK